jgi:hypothetical protein
MTSPASAGEQGSKMSFPRADTWELDGGALCVLASHVPTPQTPFSAQPAIAVRLGGSRPSFRPSRQHVLSGTATCRRSASSLAPSPPPVRLSDYSRPPDASCASILHAARVAKPPTSATWLPSTAALRTPGALRLIRPRLGLISYRTSGI